MGRHRPEGGVVMPEREKKLMEAKAALSAELRKWCDECGLTARDALALCAYMTGVAIAMQDQRTTTPELVMEIVDRNIEAGNAAVIAQLNNVLGRAQ